MKSFLDLLAKKIITYEARDWLGRAFTLQETRTALFQTSPDKAPRPDGFIASSYQKNWNLLGMSIYEVVIVFSYLGSY